MKKLHLSDKDKKIAGVCGGLAESFGISSDIVRIIFILATILGGYGLIVYLVLMLILPRETDPQVIEVYPEPEESEKGRLYRNPNNRVIAGVCSGVADYTNWDVSLVRLGFVILALMSGVGIILYLIMWLVMPERESA